MTLLAHERYCDEITLQTGLLRDLVRDADPTTEVPTCPGWTLDRLIRHIGGNLRTVGLAIRTGEAVDRPAEQVASLDGPSEQDPAALDAWFAEAAAQYADALRDAGPDGEAQVWGIPWKTSAWGRRALHDVVIHRADVALALGAGYPLERDLAEDAVDEMLELFSGLQAMGAVPALADLRGLESSIAIEAGDGGSRWLIEFGEDGFRWRRGEGAATVTLRGPLVDVLLVLYRRLPPDTATVAVLGDAAVLDFWLARVSLQ